MPRKLVVTNQVWGNPCTEIIDVRSPSEFAQDHIPGAVNLSVLSDAERHEVGSVYKQQSAFLGKKRGASIVARNIGEMLKSYFATKDENYSPLIYCFRGGQRSRSLGIILSEIGWTTYLLEGGYKRYRSEVLGRLDSDPAKFSYIVLCGLTGSGKTSLLKKLREKGEQVLDIEGLACHQGSLLGAPVDGSQPSQKYFETLIADEFRRFDCNSPIWIEGESPRLGSVHLPSSLTQCMRSNARAVFIKVPIEARVEWTLTQYRYFTERPELLSKLLPTLRAIQGGKTVDYWLSLIEAREWGSLVEDLLKKHYDPRYLRSLESYYSAEEFEVTDLSESAQYEAVKKLILKYSNSGLKKSEIAA